MFKTIGSRRIAITLILSAILFTLSASQAYLLAIALKMTIDWTYLAVSLGLTIMMMAIPVTIQGLGIREGVLLFMLTRVNLEPTLIVSFSLMFMLINITPALAGFIMWTKNPFVDITDQEILDAEVVWPPFSNLEKE